MRPRALLLTTTVSLLLVTPTAAAHAGAGCHAEGGREPTVAATTEIRLEPCAFDPDVAHVEPGDTVTFRNPHGMAHTVTGVGASMLGTDTFDAGERTWVAPDAPGVYPYACILHPGMVGAVVVGTGAEVAAADLAGATTSDPAGSTSTTIVATTIATLAAAALALTLLARHRTRP